jgi:hypothetical protein
MRFFLASLCLATAVAAAPLARIEVAADHPILAGTPVEVELRLDRPVKGLTVQRKGARSKVPAQFDPGPSATDPGTLIFLLPEPLEAGKPRIFEVEAGNRQPKADAHVSVRDDLQHQGHASIEVRTPAATWVYHKEGAGFGALIDPEGNDWITWRPGNGSAGEYRGIPNLGIYAHPGYTGEKGGITRVESRGPLRARLRSESRSGEYVVVWDFFPRHARLTIEKAGQPYWFLYEGTPGGKLDVDSDYVVTADGRKRPVAESWTGDLPGPEWLYFGDANLRRVLFLVNHQDDDANDQFYQMQGNMTVFGFGRQHRCCGRYMTAAPARFTVGLADSTGFAEISGVVDSAWRAVRTRVLSR